MRATTAIIEAIDRARREGRVTETTHPADPPPDDDPWQTEKAFLADVVKFARRHGWEEYHVLDSRKSREGFPDLIIARPGRVIVAELKVGDNEPTDRQKMWLGFFASVGIPTFVWAPGDWKNIMEILT